MQILIWTRHKSLMLLFLSVLPVLLWILDMHLAMPWTPLAVLGTACAFILTFKNNASYDRLKEARDYWQKIEQQSKGLFIFLKAFVAEVPLSNHDKASQTYMLNLFLAWLHAHRLELRSPRDWEHYDKDSRDFRMIMEVENETQMEEVLQKYLPPTLLEETMARENKASYILQQFNDYLILLKEEGGMDAFRMADACKMLIELQNHQTNNEKIKNTPFPRQYATVGRIFLFLFILLFPFGLTAEFSKLGVEALYISIPFSFMVNWVFVFLQMNADYSENPFEGLYNDVPISDICSRIETDLSNYVNQVNNPYPKRDDNILHVIV